MERNWKRFYIEGVLRDKWNELSPEQKARLDAIGFNREKRIRHREVTCFETGERFPYVKHVALSLGCSEGRVRSAIVRRTPINGFHFYYSDEGKPSSDNFRKLLYGRPVICFETGEKFSTSGVVAERYGVTSNRVIDAIKKRHSVGEEQLHFYFADEPRPDDAFFKPYYGRLDTIECVETGMCFDTMIEAARYAGVKTSHSIRLAIDNGGRAGRYHWRFKHNETLCHDFKRPLKRGCVIYCAETGEMFDNLSAAARWLDCDMSLIRDAIRRGGTCRGYHWFYADEMEDATQLIFAPDPRLTRVRCVETREEFPSIKSAAEWCGVASSNLSAVLAGKQKSTGGYHWERVVDDEKVTREEE